MKCDIYSVPCIVPSIHPTRKLVLVKRLKPSLYPTNLLLRLQSIRFPTIGEAWRNYSVLQVMTDSYEVFLSKIGGLFCISLTNGLLEFLFCHSLRVAGLTV